VSGPSSNEQSNAPDVFVLDALEALPAPHPTTTLEIVPTPASATEYANRVVEPSRTLDGSEDEKVITGPVVSMRKARAGVTVVPPLPPCRVCVAVTV
jgi:hypothetical protein